MTLTHRIFLAITLSTLAPHVMAETSERNPRHGRTLMVQGSGKVDAVPDIARLSVEVSKEGTDVEAIASDVRSRIAKVLDVFKKEGVAEKDIRTENYTVTPRWEQDRAGNRRRNGFIVANRASGIVRDIRNVGKILSALVKAGADNIDGPDFDFADPRGLERKALAAAMDDAKAKAAALASAGGVRLGELISADQIGAFQWPGPQPRMMRAMAMDLAAEPVMAGEKAVNAAVTATFSIQ